MVLVEQSDPERNPPSLRVSPLQKRILEAPEEYDLFLGGGRGGGKSWSIALVILRHVEQFGEHARVLYLRRTYPGLRDFEGVLREVFGLAYPNASYNAGDHCWRGLPNGAHVELGQLEDESQFQKFQGRSFSLICVDEAGHYPDPSMIDRLRSNLRGPIGVPTRMVLAANPGDVGHHWLSQRYVLTREPWVPFTEEHSGREFIYCPSTYDLNPFIDGGYLSQLEAACASDPALLKAWVTGDWTIARGAYFGTTITKDVALGPWTPEAFAESQEALRPYLRRRYDSVAVISLDELHPPEWLTYLAHDFGSAAPSATYVCGISPGAKGPDGFFYPRDSVLLLDELATNEPGSLTKGLGWTIPKLAEAIRELAARWGIEPRGCADDAIFAKTRGVDAPSIAEEFAAEGVYFEPAQKADRLTGWQRMRTLLSQAGRPDLPGLYVSRACEYWWATVPVLPRDPKRQEDLDSRGPDHGADACRYALTYDTRPLTPVEVI